MPYDVFTLHFLVRELQEILVGGKIIKINQPENDELAFLIHNQAKTHQLLMSCSPNLPRINISTQKTQNPIVAPSFCMSLRKHISSGIITNISLLNNDRIIDFTISAYGEMLDKQEYHLIFEIMGRYSNIILVNDNMTITSCCKQIPFGESNRQILSGLTYEPPKTNEKISILDSNLSKLKTVNVVDLKAFVNEKLMGFSTQTLNEFIYRTENNGKGNTSGEKLYNTIIDLLSQKKCSPVYTEKDFFAFPYNTTALNYISCDNLSSAIENCLSVREKTMRLTERAKSLTSAVKNAISRTEKKIIAQEQKLLDCEKTDLFKLYGDLLLINLYRNVKNIDGITVANVYDNNQNIDIPLDCTKNLKQNAQEYYRKYAKLKRTRENVNSMLAENKTLIGYLKNVQRELCDVQTDAEIEDIKNEIFALGLSPAKAKTANKQKMQSLPHKYYFDNTVILVGKNNFQNDKLTFGTAHKNDYWFHIKDYHGSHIIVGSANPNQAVINFAGELAAFYSEIKGNAKIVVDYTQVKNVKKNGALGMVTYTNYSSLTISPNSHLDYLQ